MLNWMKKERCKLCHSERSVRYCLRRNKEIGWQCCNRMRIDTKCPNECPYAPVRNENSPTLPGFKSDSRTEFLDCLELYLQIWIFQKNNLLDNLSPRELCNTSEGKSRIKEWLSSFAFPIPEALGFLNAKLELELDLPEPGPNEPEQITSNFLNLVIAQEWSDAMSIITEVSGMSSEIIDLLTDDLRKNPVLSKTRHYSIINAGLTEDGRQAFVFCELNGKDNWTIIFGKVNDKWHLHQNISGTLQDYYAQKNLFRSIALTLNTQDEPTSYKLLSQAGNIYPLCPDIFYYYGLYHLLNKNRIQAESSFKKALALEPDWSEPLFRLALIDMQKHDYQSALLKWESIIAHNPADENVLNNIGVCYLGLEQTDKAKNIWQEALKTFPNSELLKKNLEHLQNG